MAFTGELESNIRAAYLKIIEKKHLGRTPGKTLNCDSFRKITEEIKSVMGEGLKTGLGVLEIANNIIFKILKENFFVYENHEMATLIGYIYLKRQGVTINNYSVDGITNNSTLEDVVALTKSW
jgi:prophage maintenance system killer protein